ncbi:hypothetical protein PhCBS80983_g01755 [Powellomyces hirtus]|uniref:TatD DNase family protein n=1 Tax=Powellomyces hirtus TaxID=109895 RepID=A0A507E947_9FUNG|nr:hypothetical protein PhCBS80983_g01755 [Powellomyces hirtus]
MAADRVWKVQEPAVITHHLPCRDKDYMMLDCHAHIYSPEFSDVQQTLEAAYAAGVRAILNVSETVEDALKILELAQEYPILQPCLGLHPVQPGAQGSRSVRLDEVDKIMELIRENSERIVAIGECGLDFSPHVLAGSDVPPAAQKEIQKKVFGAQLCVANEIGVPVNVHSRQAGHYAVDLMIEAGSKGLLHAFDGKVGHALKAVHNGCLISIAPSVVRSPHLQKLAKAIPLDHLVLETDSPALGPANGVQNVPANVRIACEHVAKIKGMSFEDVEAMTTENAMKMFRRVRPVE